MELHGTIAENLQLAIRSARRLRNKAVHPDTIAYWEELLREARLTPSEDAMPTAVDALVQTLQTEISDRSAPAIAANAQPTDIS